MKIKIITPVFNDWEALKLLIKKTQDIYKKYDISYLVINDCSNVPYKREDFENYDLEVLHLVSNQGHQRAIAIGLSYFADNYEADKVIVMDSDGEDQPEHIEQLLGKSQIFPDKIIFAERRKRTESFLFRFFYQVYKIFFKSLTGKVITFGNFSLLPTEIIKKVANVSEIWNNYPGAIIRSKLPFDSVPLDRGSRLAGESKMNFSSLVLHGLSAVSVFLDVVVVRIVIFTALLIVSAIIGVGIVLYLKYVLHQATPGWATSIISGFLIVILQGFFIALFVLFMVLNGRRNPGFVPYLGYKNYVDFVE